MGCGEYGIWDMGDMGNVGYGIWGSGILGIWVMGDIGYGGYEMRHMGYEMGYIGYGI